MYKFPAWVGGPKEPDAAQRRLRYFLVRASIEATDKGTIAAIADLAGVERTHMHAAMREGSLSAKMAAAVEKACGRKVIRREWLIHPMDYEEMVDQ